MSYDLKAIRNGNKKHLYRANLSWADLSGAILEGANLSEANLYRANLSEANLYGANFSEASLERANLEGAILDGANLDGAELPDFERLPEEESFVAYKGCVGNVVKLRVPANAERTSSLKGPKCRAEFVEVVEVLDENGEPCDEEVAESWYDGSEYIEGEEFYPDEWNPNPRVECTNGVHLYPTKNEAVDAVR